MIITIRMTEASNDVGAPGEEGFFSPADPQRPWSLQFLSSPVQMSDTVHLKLTSFFFFFNAKTPLHSGNTICRATGLSRVPGSLCWSQLDSFLCFQSTLLSPHQGFDCGFSVCSPLLHSWLVPTLQKELNSAETKQQQESSPLLE